MCLSIFSDTIFNDTKSYYQPLYHSNDKNLYKVRNADEEYKLSKSEYSFSRKANKLGYPDFEWTVPKSPGTIRIICLGDSFTEGDGASSDSSYVRILQQNLQKKFPNIEFFNAGTCGSDPFIHFKSLKEKLYLYQPDIILQSFTSNDYYQDFITRGGNERFQTDGSLKYKKTPWWERIYASNYIFRIFISVVCRYDNLFLKSDDYSKIEIELDSISSGLFRQYNSYTNEKQIDLLVFTIPFKKDFEFDNTNKDFFEKFERKFSDINLKFYNLHPCYNDYILHSNSHYKDYYWVHDGHHNARGYKMMAKCIEEIIGPVIEKRIANKNTLVN